MEHVDQCAANGENLSMIDVDWVLLHMCMYIYIYTLKKHTYTCTQWAHNRIKRSALPLKRQLNIQLLESLIGFLHRVNILISAKYRLIEPSIL